METGLPLPVPDCWSNHHLLRPTQIGSTEAIPNLERPVTNWPLLHPIIQELSLGRNEWPITQQTSPPLDVCFCPSRQLYVMMWWLLSCLTAKTAHVGPEWWLTACDMWPMKDSLLLVHADLSLHMVISNCRCTCLSWGNLNSKQTVSTKISHP